MFAAVEALIKKKIEVRPVPGFDGTRAATYPGESPEDSRGERGRGRARGGRAAERGAERSSRPPRDEQADGGTSAPRGEATPRSARPARNAQAEDRPPRTERQAEGRPPRSGKRAEERPPRPAQKPAAGEMDFSKPYEPAAGREAHRAARRVPGAQALHARRPGALPPQGGLSGRRGPQHDCATLLRASSAAQDYAPPAYLVDTVVLDVDIATALGDRPREARRCAATPRGPAAPLVLDGAHLELLSVALDGTAAGRIGLRAWPTAS